MPYKALLIFISNWHRFMAGILNSISLKANGVSCKTRPVINGRVIIRNKGKIELGEQVLINNASEFNPVGLPHPVILCTQNKGAKITIGSRVGISGASLVAATSISIGDRTLIGGGAGIWDTDFHPLDPEQRKVHQTKGAQSAPIVIEEDVFVGARAIILKGVTIGKGAVIGAGAVVSRDVPPYATAYGNPLIIKEKQRQK
ncbi:MAG: acyltransferase [Owenweeksia sp.]|nr:acyltransferase [Owenweeksia sp.]